LSTKAVTQNHIRTTSSGILIFERGESLFFSTFLSPCFGLYIVIVSDLSTQTTVIYAIQQQKLFVGVANIQRAPALTVSN